MIPKPILRKASILRLLIPLYLILTATLSASAYDFKVDGICYNILDDSRVEVTSGSTKYSGDVIIPESVEYNENSYSVTSIGDYAFKGCTGLTSVTIGKLVETIGSYAFKDCTGLTSVTIGESVETIGDWAFYWCDGLTSVTIGESVETIGWYAFKGCTGLTSVTIGNSVTSIGDRAFESCSGLKEVHISSLESWCNISFGNAFSNPLYMARKLYLNGKLVKDLIIPESVSEIKNYAFYGCSGLTSITIPNSVTSIGDAAFMFCYGLTSVTLGESVETIGYEAFYWCYALTSITIPISVTSIGDFAFYNCTGLTQVNIYSLESWCNISFERNSSNPLYCAQNLYLNGKLVKDLIIPESIKQIKPNTFLRGSCLTSVTIGESVETIGWYAFEGCTGLTSVTIGSSVTSIGWDAFNDCTSLTSVTIGKSVKTIGNYAFSGCSDLELIKSLAPIPPSVDNNSFESDTYQTATLEVLPESLNAYKEHPIWSKFLIKELSALDNIENPDDDFSFLVDGGSIHVNAPEGAKIDIYNMSGNLVRSTTDQTIDGLTSGIYILRRASKSHKIFIK